MPDIKNDSIQNACQTLTGTVKVDRSVLTGSQSDYASAKEAIGSLCREVMRSRGYIFARDIKLMLMVRLTLCTDPSQKPILLEALRLMINKPTAVV